jgi:hypothetical protein
MVWSEGYCCPNFNVYLLRVVSLKLEQLDELWTAVTWQGIKKVWINVIGMSQNLKFHIYIGDVQIHICINDILFYGILNREAPN